MESVDLRTQLQPDQAAQIGLANEGDWREEVYQKIKQMKEQYLPELSEMYQKIVTKLQEFDSLPNPPKPDMIEKLKLFRSMLERAITFLQMTKAGIQPGYKEKLAHYEKQIINFINTNRPRKPKTIPTMQPSSAELLNEEMSNLLLDTENQKEV